MYQTVERLIEVIWVNANHMPYFLLPSSLKESFCFEVRGDLL